MLSVDSSSAVEIGLEESFSLACALEQGSDSVEWDWLKNGAPVINTTWREGELTVLFSEETDEGIYQCIASNKVGRDMRTFTVRVISK